MKNISHKLLYFNFDLRIRNAKSINVNNNSLKTGLVYLLHTRHNQYIYIYIYFVETALMMLSSIK